MISVQVYNRFMSDFVTSSYAEVLFADMEQATAYVISSEHHHPGRFRYYFVEREEATDGHNR